MVDLSSGKDSFELERFVVAQGPVYPTVLQELGRGRKSTHWMWFIFPQLRSLGSSARAIRYGIGSLDEAAAYLSHRVLGARLRECARLLLGCQESSISRIMPFPDDLKLQSSMTLFAEAAGTNRSEDQALFRAVLERFFNGARDGRTLALLSR